MIWIAVLLLLYLAILSFALWISFHPFRTPIFISPGALLTPQEEFEVETKDGVAIRGWWVEHPNPKGIAILVHGYMMNRSELSPLAVWLHRQGWSSAILDLRAHGKSGGKRSTFGVRESEDVAAAARWAKGKAPGVPLILLGSSMGAAAAAFAAAEEPGLADGLVLDSAYSQLPKAVLGWWYFLGGTALKILLAPTVLLAAPLVGFNPYQVDVARSLKKLTIPVLLIHGSADTLAAPAQAERNCEACGDRGELVWLAECGHSEGRWIHPEIYYGALGRFLERVASPEKGATGNQAVAAGSESRP